MMKSFLDHLKSGFNQIAKTIYATNNRPCGIPSSFTYCGSPFRYLIGTATNNKSKYDMPSKNAVILKILTIKIQIYNITKIQ